VNNARAPNCVGKQIYGGCGEGTKPAKVGQTWGVGGAHWLMTSMSTWLCHDDSATPCGNPLIPGATSSADARGAGRRRAGVSMAAAAAVAGTRSCPPVRGRGVLKESGDKQLREIMSFRERAEAESAVKQAAVMKSQGSEEREEEAI
jgi:hypothetical protein